NNAEQKTKLTLAEVYNKILDDCTDDVIADLKPGTVKTVYRFGSDFGYGVRARVLFQMKRYPEALVYAEKALGVNDQIEDRSSALTAGKWVAPYDADNNYLLINSDGSNLGDLYSTVVTGEVASMFEYGDFVKDCIMNPMEGWSDIYNDYVFPDCLMFVGGDTRFNIWGLRSESMYYLAAECLIRSNRITEGMAKLDAVRLKRIYSPELYSAKTDLTEAEAMELYQRCRMVEFVGTFENFFDRKRWNTEDKYKKTITHDLHEHGTFTIAPDSKLWIYPFPTKARNMNTSLTNNY
ncbi:MAG: RagB/SusD family nutrient uptake outer membrane protein, partial [Duncaniella sp.]|nr:RagB/SusD family nutrient uptake outer membrane protein [Duncaniella sp.]